MDINLQLRYITRFDDDDLTKADLRLLVEWLQPLDNQNSMALLEIIEDRHGKNSTIITSQLPINDWYDVIGEKTVADAILDRLVHDAQRIELKGESMRKTRMNNKKE